MSVSTTLNLTVRLGEPGVVASYLEMPGVVKLGHFRLLSGLHTDTFLAFSRVAENTGALDSIAGWLLPTAATWTPTVVVAPRTAGVGLAATLARALGCRLVLATLDQRGRAVEIEQHNVEGERVLLVNDIVTTGDGLLHLANATREAGGYAIGGAWFASRSSVDVADSTYIPVAYVADVPLGSWQAHDCEACRREEPFEEALDLN